MRLITFISLFFYYYLYFVLRERNIKPLPLLPPYTIHQDPEDLS